MASSASSRAYLQRLLQPLRWTAVQQTPASGFQDKGGNDAESGSSARGARGRAPALPKEQLVVRPLFPRGGGRGGCGGEQGRRQDDSGGPWCHRGRQPSLPALRELCESMCGLWKGCVAFAPSQKCSSLFDREKLYRASLERRRGEGEASMLSSTLNLFKGQVYFG